MDENNVDSKDYVQSEDQPLEEAEDSEEDTFVDEGQESYGKWDPDRFTIEVHFELGKFTIPLGKLREMNPGYKIPININPKKVHLVVDGKAIGIGELIEVGGILGVKLVELY